MTDKTTEAPENEKESDVKVFNAGLHTLIIKELEPEFTSINIPAKMFKEFATDLEDSVLSTIKQDIEINVEAGETCKLYTLYVGDFDLSDNNIGDFNRLIFELGQAEKFDKIEISIASNGGCMSEGLRMIEIIKATFKHENITTSLSPHGYSMGSHLFVIGAKRIVTEDAAIMIHDYSTGVFGKGSNIKDYIKHAEKRLNRLAEKQYVKTKYITEAEFAQFKDGKDLWFETSEMISRKIATHVMLDSGDVIKAEDYV